MKYIFSFHRVSDEGGNIKMDEIADDDDVSKDLLTANDGWLI